MGTKATTKPAAINDRRMVRLAMCPKLLSLPVRKPRLIFIGGRPAAHSRRLRHSDVGTIEFSLFHI